MTRPRRPREANPHQRSSSSPRADLRNYRTTPTFLVHGHTFEPHITVACRKIRHPQIARPTWIGSDALPPELHVHQSADECVDQTEMIRTNRRYIPRLILRCDRRAV